ncbi:TRAP transporter substrate-binding protein [Aquicoccus sp. G2-2]|uniref:TRAP transporter substrate-binding protein n=1 Tax=Aquicoccus sp. G2-2 TaxID=3092120 RepID=UPI002ADFF505|nr:TRAP transporter substrate-binding protein [Aquicoccus sp. G2-2]MEA1112262.1 TRAP transporter substrate-binding protein [Aquicoccus sp. G2-2]
MITKRKLIGLAAGAAMAAGMSPGIAVAQDVTLKLHQFLPAQANVPKLVLAPWAKRVEEASKGKIKIDLYPSMQLGGKPPELADQVKDGVADIVWTVLGYTPGRFPQAEVFELPFMMSNAEDTSRAYWQYAQANMMDTDFKDYKILAVWVHGPGLIHSNKPVRVPADLNGMKLRAPTRIITKMLSELGATPVGMPVPAIPEALSKGVIDGAVIPWEVTGALKVQELVHNHTEFPGHSLYTTAFVLAMNKEKFDSLSQELKDAIDSQSGEDFSALAGKLQASGDAPQRAKAVEMGNNIIELTPDEIQQWIDASSKVAPEWAKEMDAKGFDGQALLDQARALIKKNTK